MKIAALFVETNGIYFGLPNVDPWDVQRDARQYAGPHPVVAHPPCDRWCQMAPVNQARYGHKVGEDGGCFAAALAAVRNWGGVLEHPAVSLAWPAFDLPKPPRSGGWLRSFCGGWVAHVEQRHYGHRARKATWLYAFGVNPPELKWGKGPAPEAWISADRPRAVLAAAGIGQLSKKEAKATPLPFRDLLLSLAGLGKQIMDVDKSKLREWADDFEAAAHDVPKGIKSTILMTRAQEIRRMLQDSPLAQRIEHEPSKLGVEGSNPSGRTNLALR